ncbi:MAG: Gfo/Idh/MocA family oxidoreductase [Oscillospiraceae bacterium]|jgi:predicted dehydrogenase|nr:Gfo/Idh/MocA family oxidoreductase [Oscillospiraceae bacterium]
MIRVAIVGVGTISRLHIEAYQTFPDRCKIVAFADIIPERAFGAIERLKLPQARAFASHTDMLSAMSDEIDLVSVCTPPYCHAEIAIDSLKAGCNALVEKPMAASLAECDAMLAAEKESGKILGIVAQNRFRTPVRSLKAVLDSGSPGRILHAQVDSFWWRGHNYYDLWWRGRWDKEGGGCTLNHAVHHIDMLIWMMGLPHTVTAVLSNATHDNAEVEDVSVAVLEYPQGSIAQVTSSVIHYGGDSEQQLVFQCEKARVSVPWRVSSSIVKPNGFPDPNEELERELNRQYEAIPSLEHEGHAGEIDDLLSAIETSGRPLIDGNSGRRTLELITAIYKAGSFHVPISLPLKQDDPFYTVEGILANAPRFFEKTVSLESLEGDITTGSDYAARL